MSNKRNIDKSEIVFMVSVLIVTIILIGYVAWKVIENATTRQICVREETVLLITELDYREATIYLANGESHVVNQVSLKLGDKFCSEYKRIKN